MSEEIAKMALECLKTKLEGDKAQAESEGKMWEGIGIIVNEVGKVLPMLLEEGGGKKGQIKRFFPALTKEDLRLFAKKAPLQDLEAIVRDLTASLESRKKAEPT